MWIFVGAVVIFSFLFSSAAIQIGEYPGESRIAQDSIQAQNVVLPSQPRAKRRPFETEIDDILSRTASAYFVKYEKPPPGYILLRAFAERFDTRHDTSVDVCTDISAVISQYESNTETEDLLIFWNHEESWTRMLRVCAAHLKVDISKRTLHTTDADALYALDHLLQSVSSVFCVDALQYPVYTSPSAPTGKVGKKQVHSDDRDMFAQLAPCVGNADIALKRLSWTRMKQGTMLLSESVEMDTIFIKATLRMFSLLDHAQSIQTDMELSWDAALFASLGRHYEDGSVATAFIEPECMTDAAHATIADVLSKRPVFVDLNPETTCFSVSRRCDNHFETALKRYAMRSALCAISPTSNFCVKFAVGYHSPAYAAKTTHVFDLTGLQYTLDPLSFIAYLRKILDFVHNLEPCINAACAVIVDNVGCIMEKESLDKFAGKSRFEPIPEIKFRDDTQTLERLRAGDLESSLFSSLWMYMTTPASDNEESSDSSPSALTAYIQSNIDKVEAVLPFREQAPTKRWKYAMNCSVSDIVDTRPRNLHMYGAHMQSAFPAAMYHFTVNVNGEIIQDYDKSTQFYNVSAQRTPSAPMHPSLWESDLIMSAMRYTEARTGAEFKCTIHEQEQRGVVQIPLFEQPFQLATSFSRHMGSVLDIISQVTLCQHSPHQTSIPVNPKSKNNAALVRALCAYFLNCTQL
jgi:hypothetical protein